MQETQRNKKNISGVEALMIIVDNFFNCFRGSIGHDWVETVSLGSGNEDVRDPEEEE